MFPSIWHAPHANDVLLHSNHHSHKSYFNITQWETEMFWFAQDPPPSSIHLYVYCKAIDCMIALNVLNVSGLYRIFGHFFLRVWSWPDIRIYLIGCEFQCNRIFLFAQCTESRKSSLLTLIFHRQIGIASVSYSDLFLWWKEV